MNNILIIKDVFDQCRENDWLGTEASKFRCRGITGCIIGYNAAFDSVVVHWDFFNIYEAIPSNEMIEWVGNKQQGCDQTTDQCHARGLYPDYDGCKCCEHNQNKPKTKKLHACIRTMKTEDGVIQYLAFEDKEWFQDSMQWLPEDKYPPAESEEK